MEYPEHEGVRVWRIREYTVLAQQFAVLTVYNYTVNCVVKNYITRLEVRNRRICMHIKYFHGIYAANHFPRKIRP